MTFHELTIFAKSRHFPVLIFFQLCYNVRTHCMFKMSGTQRSFEANLSLDNFIILEVRYGVRRRRLQI